MKKAEKICVTGVMVIMGFLMAGITSMSFGMTAEIYEGETTAFLNDHVLWNVIGFLAAIVLAWWIQIRKIRISNRFLKGYVIIINLILLWFVISTQFASRNDQGIVMNMASALLHGNYEYWKIGGYGYRCTHQNGIVLIFALFSWIFGNGNDLAIQLLNVAFMFGGYYYMYRICKNIFPSEEIANRVLFLLYAFLPYLFYVTFEYGTVIGVMFILGGFYHGLCFLRDLKWKDAVLSALFCAMATVCKSNFYIYVIAILIVTGVHALFCGEEGKNSRCRVKKLVFGAGIIITCLLFRLAVYETILGITGEEPGRGTPASVYVAMGLSDGMKAPGWNNGMDYILMEVYHHDYDVVHQEAQKIIRQSLQGFLEKPEEAGRFFTLKIASMWANPTFQCDYLLQDREANPEIPGMIAALIEPGNPVNGVFRHIFDVIQSVLYAGVLLYCLLRMRKKERENVTIQEMLCAITFIGIFLFHVFWEGKCYYTVPCMVLLIPYSVMGYHEMGSFLENVGNNRRDWMATLRRECSLFWCLWGVVLLLFCIGVYHNSMKDLLLADNQEDYRHAMENNSYHRRLDEEPYRICAYSDTEWCVDITTVDSEGTRFILKKVSDSAFQNFRFLYCFTQLGKNEYFLENMGDGRTVYLRSEDSMYEGFVYLQSYSNEKKSLIQVKEEEDYCYILNRYGLAMTQDMETGKIRWSLLTGEENQKWVLERVETK